MAQIKINVAGLGEIDGEAPIVIVCANGSGKTQLASNPHPLQKPHENVGTSRQPARKQSLRDRQFSSAP
jgi:hypothetical protein